jgi:hypothetical protein
MVRIARPPPVTVSRPTQLKFFFTVAALMATLSPIARGAEAEPVGGKGAPSDQNPPDLVIELLRPYDEASFGDPASWQGPTDPTAPPVMKAARSNHRNWSAQSTSRASPSTPPSASEALADAPGGGAIVNPAGEAPGKMMLNGQNTSRFRLSFGALELSEFMPPQTALRLIPIDATSGARFFYGDPGSDNPATDFYPHIAFEPCSGLQCFSRDRTAAAGLRASTGQTWGSFASVGFDRALPTGSNLTEHQEQVWAPDALFTHVAVEQSAGTYRVRSDGNTPLTPSDDSWVTLNDNASSTLHAVVTSQFRWPVPNHEKNQTQLGQQSTSPILWDASLWTFSNSRDLGSPLAESQEARTGTTPHISRQFQAVTLQGRGFDPATGQRTQARIAFGHLDELVTQSLIDPGRPRVRSQIDSLQSELQVRVPRTTANTNQSTNQPGLILSVAHRMTALSRRLEAAGASGSERTQTSSRHMWIPSVGIHTAIFQARSASVLWGVGASFPMAWHESDTHCANTPATLCSGKLKAFETTEPSLHTQLRGQWFPFQTRLFLAAQSRLPDSSERFGSGAGVIPNPRLLPERRLLGGIGIAMGSELDIIYSAAQEERLIAPQQGAGSVVIFTNQEDIERHHVAFAIQTPEQSALFASVRYDRTWAWYKSRANKALPGQPEHMASISLAHAPAPIWSGNTYQLGVVSECSANWQSAYPLDRENLIAFTPRLRLNPAARLILEAPRGLRLVGSVEASLLLPRSGATENNKLGSASSIPHEGVEGLQAPSETYTLSLRGEF